MSANSYGSISGQNSFPSSSDASSSTLNNLPHLNGGSGTDSKVNPLLPNDGAVVGFGKYRAFGRNSPTSIDADKTWMRTKRAGDRISNLIIIIGIILGVGIVIELTYSGYAEVPHIDYCPVLLDDFSEGLKPENWAHEVQIGGFGAGSFDWTTTSSNNTFVENGQLHILPTLTNETIGNDNLIDGYEVDLIKEGECTGWGGSECIAHSSKKDGSIIPPIQSARLTTRFSANIKYGKVEVRAKLPRGDWIWPAIWMMPSSSVYGVWPRSGEIDIVESRGNDHTYPIGGRNDISSSIHWGPSSDSNRFWMTSNHLSLKRNLYCDTFHTFGFEWTDKELKMYLDGRLTKILHIKFFEPFWTRGEFGDSTDNPWAEGSIAAPFDQEFFLIMNVAVGSSSGYFPDGMGNKPWADFNRDKAMSDFWDNREHWLSTWPEDPFDRAMVVDSVKIFKQC